MHWSRLAKAILETSVYMPWYESGFLENELNFSILDVQVSSGDFETV